MAIGLGHFLAPVPFFQQEQTEQTEQTELAESFQPDVTFKATGPAQHDPLERDGRAVIAKRP